MDQMGQLEHRVLKVIQDHKELLVLLAHKGLLVVMQLLLRVLEYRYQMEKFLSQQMQ